MRAIRFDGVRVTLDPRAEAPAPAPGEALIRPLCILLAPSDIAFAQGRSPARKAEEPPLTIGREFVGIVERLHPDADRELRKKWEGKRVVGSPLIVCGRCDMCRAGLAAHCRSRLELGVHGWDGCLADRFRLPLRNLVEVPDRLGDQAAVFAVALSAAAHAAHLVRAEGKPYITVLGDGAAALLCAQAMARLNASVRLLGAHAARFSLCEKWGIKHRDEGEVGRRADQDIVVEATPRGRGLDLALRLVRPRGKIVLMSPPADDPPPAPHAPPTPLAAIVENEIEVIGCRGGSVADAAAMLSRGEVDVLPLVTRRARLADTIPALQAASEPEQVAVLIEP